jgi:transcriptional regulator with XRE-family HTH domain
MKIEDLKTGKELKEFRKSLNLSQESFAHIIGYTMNRISTIECKEANLSDKVKRKIKENIIELIK